MHQRENDQLKEQLQQQAVQLRNRELQIKNAGSIAEAALALNGVFESADKAAAQYMENIKRCSEQQKDIYDRIVSEAEQKAKTILSDAENEKLKRINEADEYWKNLNMKLEEFYQSHVGLRELLSVQSGKKTSENR